MQKEKKKFIVSGKNTIITLVVVLLLIVIAVFVKIYVIKESPYLENKEQAIKECVDLCKNIRTTKGIGALGPCLDNQVVEGWACDVTHNPKIPLIDDAKENKCHGYRHVVEVDFDCKLVSAK